jgi:hypothetical protein
LQNHHILIDFVISKKVFHVKAYSFCWVGGCMCVGGREDNEYCGTLYTTVSAFFFGAEIFFLQIQWVFRMSKFEKNLKK